jgi:acyl-CoA synthetase (NDP forming)
MNVMKLFMEPNSVAIVGATTSTGPGSFNAVETLLNFGYRGKIFPVNPKADQILGVKAYPNVKAIPESVDLAIIATPRDKVPPLVKDCVEKGIKAAVIFAQGFSDADAQGRSLQSHILDIARQGGLRIIGPNTFGVANVFHNFATTPGIPQIDRTPAGLISQSGLFFLGLPRLRFSKIIDLGNACDLDPSDALTYFEEDPQVRVIALHLEGVRDGKRFLEVARRITQKKPIVVLKGGRSEHGAKAAQSHTGSLVGRDEVYDAAFSQCGIIRTEDIEELEDIALSLLRLPLLEGKRVAVASWAGATAVFAADACEKYGLQLAKLSTSTVNTIKRLAPPWLPIHNPLDLWAAIGLNPDLLTFGDRIKLVLEALLGEENADAVLAIIPDFVEMFGERGDLSCLIGDVSDGFPRRPLVLSCLGAPGKFFAKLAQLDRAVVFPSPERAIRALARLWYYSQKRKGKS